MTKSSSVLAGLRGWRREPVKKMGKKTRERQQISVCKGEEKSLGVSAGLQDQGEAGI